MDHFNNFMNGNFCEQTDEDNDGQFSDLPGFGNSQMCFPVDDSLQNLEPMPALPQANDMMGSYSMNNSNSNADMFGSFPDESQMPNSNQMMSQMDNTQMNSTDQLTKESIANNAASTAFDKSTAVQPSQSGIKFYSRNDVLCGRGGGTNVHPGNRRFRDLINANRRAYLKARKNDKPAISRSIVRTIREMNGRFLKKDEKLGLWFEIGDDGAREKTSQALRQRAPEMKKILFEDEQRMRNEQLARQQQQQALLQRSFMNNSNSFSNNFSRNSQLLMNNTMDDGNFGNHDDLQANTSNNGSIYEQYAMLQQKNYFAREQDVFLKKLAMNGFDPSNFQNQQRNIDSLTSQTLLSQGIKPITPRGA
jgi:hypothetical protein